MKEERMTILRMLENGTITAQEATALLGALQKESSGKDILEKAGDALNALAKKAGKLEPKVKETAEKVSQKASVVMEDARTYMEQLRKKREGGEYAWDEEEVDEEDFEQADIVATQSTEAPIGAFQEEVVEETAETAEETEDDSECVEQADVLMKNLESYLNVVEMQMNQLDDAEAFLKGAFGDIDDEDWMDDEETEEKKATEVTEEAKEIEAPQEKGESEENKEEE